MSWGFDVSGHRSAFSGDVSGHRSVFGLVVFGGVDGVGANDFAGRLVDGEGFGAVDEQDDALSVVGVADAEVA